MAEPGHEQRDFENLTNLTNPNPPVTPGELVGLRWRTSTFSPGSRSRAVDCLEVARLPDGRTAVRNRNRPEAGTVVFTAAEMDAWIRGCKAGEFDDIGDLDDVLG